MPNLRGKSRRNFLTHCLTGAVALGASANFRGSAEVFSPGAQSRVVVARDPMLRGAGAAAGQERVDPRRMEALLDRAMLALFGGGHAAAASPESIVAAWRNIARPGDAVGLKVNTLGGKGISTNVELVAVVCERLQQAGVKAADIVVWDRDTEELERAGFHINIGGDRVQCYGTDRVDYEDYLSAWGSVGSCVSKILTRSSSVLINLPVLKDHDGAGVTIALKNMYGTIHNPNKYHPNGCDPYVADVNMLPEIRSRMKLVICDAITAMYEGGPGFKPEHSWKCNGLLVSQDPVALDSTGWQMIERKRAEMGLKTLEAEKRAPRYIATAADSEHRLGHSDPSRVVVVEA
ncbi:conserved exported hypothetical protein [Candidatus Sulfotelmatomonas gaucii]|uniref:DUF362 domain-containing protein n=1 Tax=Candidatus Sulfuritelmatomonas gaucii TaxID=2043161 RepID=A0A2N9L4H5_9BACT|nr:conserved exported hypothetical protein [Candidatus Sulfotelmatomonas gaucii]